MSPDIDLSSAWVWLLWSSCRFSAVLKKVSPKRGDTELLEREAELQRLLEDLVTVDKGLPFAMAAKARARTNLASAYEGCADKTTLPLAIFLYDAAADETEVALGVAGRTVVENLRRRVKTLEDQLEA